MQLGQYQKESKTNQPNLITLNWLKPKTKPYYAWSSKACIDGIWGNKFGF